MASVPVRLPAAGEQLRLLAVHAHPDDESSKGAAATAKYVAEGARVLVVSCTGGERGDLLNPGVDLAGRPIAEVRRAEMAHAAEVLGVDHVWLGFEDSGYPQGDPPPPLPPGCFADLPLAQVAEPLVRIVRQFRPHVMTTYDENGGYPHPDHIRAHEVARYAWDAAADPGHPQQGEPWAVAKLYYHHTFTRTRVVALHDALTASGQPSPYVEWLDGWEEADDSYPRVTTRIDCSDYFPVRDAALRAHATQIDPAGAWFAASYDLQQQVWPTEDFELALSRIGTVAAEDDLFHGLRSA